MKCAACGSTNLIEGKVVEAENAFGDCRFQPSETSFFRKIVSSGMKKISGFACVQCGNLQLQVQFDKEDLRRYQTFEGEQPSILERLENKTPSVKE